MFALIQETSPGGEHDESAQKEKLEFIITRNLDDFKKSKVTAYTAGEYLALIGADLNGGAV